jgi:hypothetical protein
MARYLFVTGKLAAQSLQDCLAGMADFEYEIAVLPISVAALMDARFIAKHLTGFLGCDRIMVPGLCGGDLDLIANKAGIEVMRGPKSLKDIPAHFGSTQPLTGYGEHRVKILAEIVDAYRMSIEEILARALYFRSSGADIIDLGCPVEGAFPEIETAVFALKEAGFLVSVDSFSPDHLRRADQAGVDFVLSLNSRNLDVARRLRCKVVVIPDMEEGPDSLDRSIRQLDEWQICIIDPILRPVGFGFTHSIEDFIRIRRKVSEVRNADGVGILPSLPVPIRQGERTSGRNCNGIGH